MFNCVTYLNKNTAKKAKKPCRNDRQGFHFNHLILRRAIDLFVFAELN